MENMGSGKLVASWLAQPIAGTAVVQQGFMDSFLQFLEHDRMNREVYTGYLAYESGYIAQGRNALCQAFLSIPPESAEWLLMLDWDVTYTPEDVYALLDAADPIEKPIICGTYITFFGGPNGDVLRPCWTVNVDGTDYIPALGLQIGEIIECTSVGMGFTLIHRSVLETLQVIWRTDPWAWFGHDWILNDRAGEDITFCDRARKAGFTIWGHGGILLGHTKAKTFTAYDMVDKRYQFKRTQSEIVDADDLDAELVEDSIIPQ